MKRYIVNVQRREIDDEGLPYWLNSAETHFADSWQSAILSHSLVGAEFESLIDEEDLDQRCEKFGYLIHWEFAK